MKSKTSRPILANPAMINAHKEDIPGFHSGREFVTSVIRL